MNLLRIKLIWSAFAIAVLIAAGAAQAQPGCIYFESPLAGSVFPVPSCTVSLKVDCANAIKVDLQARYLPEGSDSAIIVPLGSISRPPYKLIWNTSNIPNQLTHNFSGERLINGISIVAEAAIAGGMPQAAMQGGIFLTHNKAKRSMIPVPYIPAAANAEANDNFVRKAETGNPQVTANSVVTWNDKGLAFNISVQDPSFYISQPGRDIARVGLEILIDPARKRSPYPDENTLRFVVPLRGTPIRYSYTVETADGAFKLVDNHTRGNYEYNVGLTEFRGYNIAFTVPKEIFGKSIPDTIGCNLALRMFDEAGQVRIISLNGGSNHDIYSPYTWNDYYLLSKPFYMNAALQFILFPALGFLLALSVYAIIVKMRKPQLLSNFERTEEEKVSFGRVNAVIEQDLIKKDLTLEQVAQKCSLDSKELNNLVKRNTGFTFINYLQFCRTEVAKERLRSSRSSEKSIADLCGFSSAMEMERCFSKFHHTTPYKFRTQQQVGSLN